MNVTLKGSVVRDGSLTAALRLEVTGLPDNWRLHVDDGTDGTFAGADPECKGCGNRVGYLNSDIPSTMEQAYAAVFIPCVEADDGEGLYCLTCVVDGTLAEDLDENDE